MKKLIIITVVLGGLTGCGSVGTGAKSPCVGVGAQFDWADSNMSSKGIGAGVLGATDCDYQDL